MNLVSPVPTSFAYGCAADNDPYFVTGSGSLQAEANYTRLGARVEWEATSTGSFPATVFVLVSSQDEITVFGGTGDGILQATYTLNGTRLATGNVIVYALLHLSSTFIWDQGSVTRDIPFTFGIPFTLSASLEVGVSTNLTSPGDYVYGLAEYSHTASLAPFVVLDSNGFVIPGATVSSQGQDYPVDSDPVPEPGSAFFTMVGIALILAIRRHLVTQRFKRPIPIERPF